MKTYSARLLCVALLLVLALAPSVRAGWSNVWIYSPGVAAGVLMQVSQIPGYDTFTLKPGSTYDTGNAKLRIVISGATFDEFMYIESSTNTAWGDGSFTAPAYTGAGGLVFTMKPGSDFYNILGHKLMVKYFVDVAPGAQTDVNLTLNNAILQQVSVSYGRPAVTGLVAPFTPVFAVGTQGKVKVASDTSIGTVNVIGGWVEDVKCMPAVGLVGQIYAVYCRKVTNKKLGIVYGGVIGGSVTTDGIVTPGNIGTVMANNGLGSIVRPGVPAVAVGRVLAGCNSASGGFVSWPRNIGIVYMPAGSSGATISAGCGNTAPPALATPYLGTVWNVVIGSKGPTAGVSVLSCFKPKVSGKGKPLAAGTIYTSIGPSYPLNTP